MKKRFMLFLALFLLPALSWGKEEVTLYKQVPQEIFLQDSISVLNLIRYETYEFRGFSLGGETDMPITELECFLRLVAQTRPDQIVFIQGVTDNVHWRDRTNENHKVLDLNLALDRANFGLIKARERFLESAVAIDLLAPSSSRNMRGLNVYIATYEKRERADKKIHPLPAPHTLLKFPNLKVGGFIGTSFVHTKGMNFFVPTAGLLVKGNIVEVSVFGGWRPASEHRDGLEGRAQGLVGADLTLHGNRWFGFSAGFNSAWETLRRHDDDYVNRAVGFYIGPKFYVSSEKFSFKTGANFQRLKLDRYGRDDSWWNRGYGLSVELQRLFN
ncbi:MAG: hypothetical protein AAB394_04440 [Patescibacteria group bacterium]